MMQTPVGEIKSLSGQRFASTVSVAFYHNYPVKSYQDRDFSS